MDLDEKYLSEGIYILSDYNNEFEKKYFAVREKENRIYTNNQSRLLPEIEKSHKHYNEWIIRKKSSKRFIRYLKNKKEKLNILDLGCGNGWFSNKIKLLNNDVFGVDINKYELRQAASVFISPNLKFVYGNIFENLFGEFRFDIIVLNSAIQYFSDFKDIIDRLLRLINDGGEIHLLDSPIYKSEEIVMARNRTVKYYKSIGFPQMADYYNHFTFEDVNNYKNTIIYNPESKINKLKRKFMIPVTPFYWIRINKQN